MLPVPTLLRVQTERVIGSARIALALASLTAVWLDPAAPWQYARLTWILHWAYLSYAVLVAAVMWRRPSHGRLAVTTHVADIAVAATFQYLTLGPSSPFFLYFTFALFSATLRWGSRGTLRTAAVVLLTYVVLGMSFDRALSPAHDDLNRFVIRLGYLLVVTGLLVYFAQHEERVRGEVSQLARWPALAGQSLSATVRGNLQHAAGILGASHAVLAWTPGGEPWIHVAAWSSSAWSFEKRSPADLDHLVSPDLEQTSFFGPGCTGPDLVLDVSRDGRRTRWTGSPVHPLLVPSLPGADFVSTPVRTDRLSGRIFFSGLTPPDSNVMPLAEVVGREVGATLNEQYSYEQSRQVAIAEDRVRVARDLHDGVLQSLTGIRLALKALAADGLADKGVSGDQLAGLERAIAAEQREIRSFIEELRPVPSGKAVLPLSVRLESLRARLEAQWHVRISMGVEVDDALVPDRIDRAVVFMVQEAVVNALQHARPSQVNVRARPAGDGLRITVEDDGCGFPFHGRMEHATLVASNTGPRTLRERVTALGGRVDIESSPAGSRVELAVPLPNARV